MDGGFAVAEVRPRKEACPDGQLRLVDNIGAPAMENKRSMMSRCIGRHVGGSRSRVCTGREVKFKQVGSEKVRRTTTQRVGELDGICMPRIKE